MTRRVRRRLAAPRRAVVSRRAGATALVLLGLLASAPSASAHGGYPVVDGRSGGYGVLVQAARATQGGKPAIDLTTYVTRLDLGEPDLAARVELRITADGRTRTVRPRVVGDGYEAIVPGAPDAWRGWTIEAVVRGAAGSAVVRADPASDYSGVPGWLWPLLAALVVLAAVGSTAVLRRRLRRAETAAHPDPHPAERSPR